MGEAAVGEAAVAEALVPEEDRRFGRASRWGWHGMSAAVFCVAAAVLAADGHPAWEPVLAAVIAAYTAAFVWPGGLHRYLGGGRPDRRTVTVGAGYLALAYVSVGVLTWVDPNTLVVLFVLFPQTFLVLDLPLAAAAAAVLSTTYTMVLLARSGWSARALRIDGIAGVVSAVFSVAIGAYITGLVRVGERRRVLLAELTAAEHQRDEARQAAGAAAERERLSREIHDTLAQGFTSVVMLAQAATVALDRGDAGGAYQRLAQIDGAARDGLADARALVAATAPVALDGRTLPRALEQLVARFADETGVASSFVCTEPAATARPASVDVVLLRSAQEALANVRRHARARRVSVRLSAGPGGVTLEVGDDGTGFDPAAPSTGYGLAGMRARAVEVGGRVEVTSGAGGTFVSVRVP